MIIPEDKVLFLTQLILTAKKEIFELESYLSNKNEKEFSRTKDNLNKLCGEISEVLDSFKKEGD
jgi:hypothetical protein